MPSAHYYAHYYAHYDVAIVGLGAAGLCVLHEIVTQKTSDTALSIAMFDPSKTTPLGEAYSTQHPEHLLNVRAENMGIAADNPRDFFEWLKHCESEKHTPHAATDFLPRKLYGRYLLDKLQETLNLARQKNISITQIPHQVTRITAHANGYTLASDEHMPVTAAQLILATGNAFIASSSSKTIVKPWHYDFASLSNSPPSSITMIGSGLTAVDTIISVLATGYKGQIHCMSRHGWFPAAHCEPSPAIAPPAWLLDAKNIRLSTIMHAIKESLRTHVQSPWQAVIDGLRPHTITLWHTLSPLDRKRFLARYFTLWNIHRHRMAPLIHTTLMNALDSGQLHIIKKRYDKTSLKEGLVFDCTGPHYSALPQALATLLANSVLSVDATGAGLSCTDASSYKVSHTGCPPIYAMGALQLGANLESTAMPELRLQAKAIARHIVV